MRHNFTLQDDIYLVLNSDELDLHNDFALRCITYTTVLGGVLTLDWVSTPYNSRQPRSTLQCTFEGIRALIIQGDFQQPSGLALDFIGYLKAGENNLQLSQEECGYYTDEHLVFSFMCENYIRVGYASAEFRLIRQP